jgi:aminopeptidase N
MLRKSILFVPFLAWSLFIAGNTLNTRDTSTYYMEHSYDVLNYAVEMDIYPCYAAPYPKNYPAREVITFRIDSTLSSIKLNAVNTSLEIDSVGLSAVSFTHSADTLTIQLNRTYQPGEETTVKICYRHLNVTDQAFYVSGGYVFTDTPPEGARKWFPCWDRPSDKATWDVKVKVPSNVRLGSTGFLTDSTIVADSIWYHWISSDPVATYLITLTSKTDWLIYISYWHQLNNPADSLPVRLYYKPGENLTLVTGLLDSLTNFYAGKFGPYPFEKIGFATITTFPWAGMENQTMVNLKPGGYLDESLIAHEHSHQWFGDMITCGTWADIWLNEGFATYCDQLWKEFSMGYSPYKNKMNQLANYYLSNNPGWPVYNPLWAIQTPSSSQLYNVAISYYKGACVHHQLRYVLGDSLYFAVMYGYASDTALMYKNAITEDFVEKTNEITGEDYSWFFDEWIYSPNHPVYENIWEIDEPGNGEFTVTLEVTQTQTNTCFFKMPIEVSIAFSDGSDTLVTAMNDMNPQVFEWTFTKHPVSLVFDPDREILLKNATTIVGIKAHPEESGITLSQNEPNPFTGTTGISYSTDTETNIRIDILDAGGRMVQTLVNRNHMPGAYKILIDQEWLAPGIYYYRLSAGEKSITKKMIVGG